MYIHMFGSFFGLTVAKVLYHKRAVAHDNETSRYTSDIFAAVGEFVEVLVCCNNLTRK